MVSVRRRGEPEHVDRNAGIGSAVSRLLGVGRRDKVWHRREDRMASTDGNIFQMGLGRAAANWAPLTPLGFLPRTASIHPERVAVIHGARRIVYRELDARARRLASALVRLGIGPGDTVSAILPNVPAMLEAHFGVPMMGAVLNTINTRLDARTIAYILAHGEAKVLLTDREYAGMVGPALEKLGRKPLVVEVEDALYQGPGERLGELEYEALLATGSDDFAWTPPADESAPIALNYTSGTTGNPKGVVYHHRGAFLVSVGNIMMWPLPPRAVYLWTLPMFHCNGWCYTWAVTAMAGTHVCLRRVDPPLVFQLIARQGVRYPTLDGQMVADPKTLRPVPADGRTIGEVVLRGNTVMLGYLKDRAATAAAFEGGWFHTGDLAVQHPDGYIEIKDRAKDIIISGGENISSIEVEIALNRHPAVLMSAVVARPDEKWGETPCAFVQLRPDAGATAEELIRFCRDNLPHFAVPKTVVFGMLPTTSTGKVQKYALRERART